MTHATDDSAIRARAIAMIDLPRRFISWIAAALGANRSILRKDKDADVMRCTLASYSDEAFRDTRIDPSDATGLTSWQPDLPFFMQSGFGRK